MSFIHIWAIWACSYSWPDLFDDLKHSLFFLCTGLCLSVPLIYDLTIAVVLNSPSKRKDTCQKKRLVHCNFSRILQRQTVEVTIQELQFLDLSDLRVARVAFRKTSLWFTPLIPGRSWFLCASCCLKWAEMRWVLAGSTNYIVCDCVMSYVYLIVYVLVSRENTF